MLCIGSKIGVKIVLNTRRQRKLVYDNGYSLKIQESSYLVDKIEHTVYTSYCNFSYTIDII